MTLDSIREVDRANHRIRRLAGVNPPTPREGRDGEWQKYERIEPEIPVAGQGVVIVWEDLSHLGPGRIRGTHTAPVVGTFSDDPRAGPWRWHGFEEDQSPNREAEADDAPQPHRSGVVTDGDTEVITLEEGGFVLAALLNVADRHGDFEDPDAPWRVLPLPDDLPTQIDHPTDLAVLAADVGGTAVAIGRRDNVLRVSRALSHLPRGKTLAPGLLIASSTNGGSWVMLLNIPGRVSDEVAHKNITATGLTDEEIATIGGDDAAFLVAARLERRMPWSSVARWLRTGHPALDGESPLAALAGGREIDEAVLDPFSGGDPPREEWEPEAWACYEAAKEAGLSWVELLRDPADGHWMVQARRLGVDLVVADTNGGLVAGAHLGDEDDPEPDGGWREFFVTDPTEAPRRLAEMADEWLAQPNNKERVLARLIARIARGDQES